MYNKAIVFLFGIFITGMFVHCSVLETKVKPIEDSSISSLGISSDQFFSYASKLSTSGDAYEFMELRSYLGTNNNIISLGRNEAIAEEQMVLIENLICKSEVTENIENNRTGFRDGYKGWISFQDNGTKNYEVPLYEGYIFFYISQYLYYSRITEWYTKSSRNQFRWKEALSFLEDHVWTKWYERSKLIKGNYYWYFLRNRTHMGSHWAGTALYLNGLSKKSEIREQTKSLLVQYDTLLKRNLRVVENGYLWNSTYDNVIGTDATLDNVNLVQDVSHGNHVVSYILSAYEYGSSSWTLTDIERLSYTLKEFVYDRRENKFNDIIDGTSDNTFPGKGNFVGDGWVKLAKYDDEVFMIMTEFMQSRMVRKFNQEAQLKSYMHNIHNE